MDYANIEKIKSDWENRGFTCKTSSTPSGDVWSSPGHETDEVLILLEGEIEISYQGKTFHPSIGEEVLIPANEPHTVINPGKTENKMYWIYGYEFREGISGINTRS